MSVDGNRNHRSAPIHRCTVAIALLALCLTGTLRAASAPAPGAETAPVAGPVFVPVAPVSGAPSASVAPPSAAPPGAERAQAAAVRVTTTDNAALAERIEALRAEIEALHGAREGQARLESTNQRLIELNAQLRQELEILALELQTERAGATRRWLLQGAGLVLIGLLLGALLKARPRRSAWN